MRFLLDASVHSDAAILLRGDGHDVVDLTGSDRGLADADVLARSTAEDRILITYDKDFGELVFLRRQLSSGILLARFFTGKSVARNIAILETVRRIGGRLKGRFTVVTVDRIRSRLLKPP